MNTHRVSSAACVQQLRPGAQRARAFSPDSKGVTRGAFEGLLLVGLGTDTRGVEITSALGLVESATDWSAA